MVADRCRPDQIDIAEPGCHRTGLNSPFDKFPSLGERSQEISQIGVVWGKAVAASRYQSYDFPRQSTIRYDFFFLVVAVTGKLKLY
jgi:hypothetical protein